MTQVLRPATDYLTIERATTWLKSKIHRTKEWFTSWAGQSWTARDIVRLLGSHIIRNLWIVYFWNFWQYFWSVIDLGETWKVKPWITGDNCTGFGGLWRALPFLYSFIHLLIHSSAHSFSKYLICVKLPEWVIFVWLFVFLFFFLFRAPVAYGSSQDRGWIGVAAANLCPNRSNVGSELHWWPILQIAAMTDP